MLVEANVSSARSARCNPSQLSGGLKLFCAPAKGRAAQDCASAHAQGQNRTFTRGADELCQQDRGDILQASRHSAAHIVLHGPRLPLPDGAPLHRIMQHSHPLLIALAPRGISSPRPAGVCGGRGQAAAAHYGLLGGWGALSIVHVLHEAGELQGVVCPHSFPLPLHPHPLISKP